MSAPVHDSDPIRQVEIDNEQRYVDRVYTRLGELRRTVAEAEKAGYGMSRVGTHGSLVERDAMVFHAARRRHALDAEYEGLVFGRLDLAPEARRSDEYSSPVEPAVPGGEARYIGRLGLRDEEHESLVVDWRAPAAAPFYRATPTDRMGVVRRRTLRSSGETVLDVEDDLLDPAAAPQDMPVVGDGALLATLSRATGHGMRDIVATIQREQDDAIRSPALGVTLVRGGPGTGKTAVALHRAAYLLYADRNRFESGGVLVVGPSEVFVNYVSRVLPSLGEETVTLRSLAQVVEDVTATRHDPNEIAAVKGSLRMARVLARAVRDAVPGTPDRFRVLYRGQLLQLDRRALDEIRRDLLAPGPRRNAVRAKAAGHVLDALWRQSLQLLPAHRQQTREEFASEIASNREFIQFMGAWWPLLTPQTVLGWLTDPKRLRRSCDGILSRVEIDRLAGAFNPDGYTVADVALLDELDDLLGKPPVRKRARRDPYHVADGIRELTTYADRMAAARAAATERPEDYRDYAHVVVDEAQDVSPMQWRMIGRRGPHASWTIVGDPAQAAWTDAAEAARAMEAAIGTRRRSEYTLTTNYRNAAEIFDLAAAVIRRAEPQLELPTAVRSSGMLPVHHTVAPSDLRDLTVRAASQVLAEVAGTVGVITPMEMRAEVAGWFTGAGDERLQVVGSLEAKGMEYDGVIVVEPSAIRDEGRSGVRTLYVALSRATQRLTTVGTDASWLPPSPS
ncbi:HelD family protein [Planosporangium mesophilum]|uniref:DNA helicase n=1 Tax=Planosporangium mesophilum TaxID=689768 RepID=A0A8J3TAC1_9ACTN|nr:AAA family ATPase [Planosporangium mesophilum]GII21886.1 DNA helicase [Planosporangium mesophilum]